MSRQPPDAARRRAATKARRDWERDGAPTVAAWDAAFARLGAPEAATAAVAAELGIARSTVQRRLARRAKYAPESAATSAQSGDGGQRAAVATRERAATPVVAHEGETARNKRAEPEPERAPEIIVADGEIVATDRIYSLDELLSFGDADLSRFYVVGHRFGWYGPARNPAVQNQVSLRPLPAFMVPESAPPVIRRLPAPPKQTGAPFVTVAFGDTHFGGARDQWTGEIEPYHDWRALDLALQLLEYLQPDAAIHLGDCLDLPEFSTKHDRTPAEEYTTGYAVREARAWWQAVRSAVRHARLYWTEGNHDRRIRDYMRKLAKPAAVLRNPDDGPAVDLPRLMGLAELDVEYVPADRDLRFGGVWWTHGDKRERATLGAVKGRGGATAAEMLRDATECIAYAHIHRDEAGTRRLRVGGTYRRIWVASPGCLARDDGVLPGERPDEDRTQGLLVVTSWPDGSAAREVAEIESGVMTYRGRRWTARAEAAADRAA